MTRQERAAGCLIGGLVGDVVGAPVEAESAAYIRKRFRDLDEILALDKVEELFGAHWQVGRYTDDTQMTACVAEWLLHDSPQDGQALLRRFSQAYRPARRYGSGTAMVLQAFEEHPDEWRSLATIMFPEGSYGNGAAMRVAPIACRYYNDPPALFAASRLSAITTHRHPLAVQGATLQAWALASLLRGDRELGTDKFLDGLELALNRLSREGPDPQEYRLALAQIREGLEAGRQPAEMAILLGTGIDAKESVPTALYCFLASPDRFEQVVQSAVFLGGDTDTIASMAGALAGAWLGPSAIPRRWMAKLLDEDITPATLLAQARLLVVD
ncbi:MAG: ADP-ribosylglycohydrolase family protein [Vulcanimicrobiota bacterium]